MFADGKHTRAQHTGAPRGGTGHFTPPPPLLFKIRHEIYSNMFHILFNIISILGIGIERRLWFNMTLYCTLINHLYVFSDGSTVEGGKGRLAPPHSMNTVVLYDVLARVFPCNVVVHDVDWCRRF